MYYSLTMLARVTWYSTKQPVGPVMSEYLLPWGVLHFEVVAMKWQPQKLSAGGAAQAFIT